MGRVLHTSTPLASCWAVHTKCCCPLCQDGMVSIDSSSGKSRGWEASCLPRVGIQLMRFGRVSTLLPGITVACALVPRRVLRVWRELCYPRVRAARWSRQLWHHLLLYLTAPHGGPLAVTRWRCATTRTNACPRGVGWQLCGWWACARMCKCGAPGTAFLAGDAASLQNVVMFEGLMPRAAICLGCL